MQDIQKKILFHVKNHELEQLNALIKEHKDIDLFFTDEQGKTLLHYAVEKISQNGLPLLQNLLNFNLDPNAVDENFETALDVARNVNNIPGLTILKFFINKKEQEQKSYLQN